MQFETLIQSKEYPSVFLWGGVDGTGAFVTIYPNLSQKPEEKLVWYWYCDLHHLILIARIPVHLLAYLKGSMATIIRHFFSESRISNLDLIVPIFFLNKIQIGFFFDKGRKYNLNSKVPATGYKSLQRFRKLKNKNIGNKRPFHEYLISFL